MLPHLRDVFYSLLKYPAGTNVTAINVGTEDDPEFQDEDDYLDYSKVHKFIESKPDLTDEELWSLISSQNGNAYYQSFKRWDEDAGHYVEISENDFDAYGKYKY